MTSPLDELHALLKTHGYSLTAPRQVVFEALLTQEPLSMRELINRTKGKLDRASLYRTVAVFETVGAVQRLYTGWKYKIELTDKFAEHHHHLTCSNCKAVIPINESALESFIEQSARWHNFQPTSHQVEIQGYCMSCQKT